MSRVVDDLELHDRAVQPTVAHKMEHLGVERVCHGYGHQLEHVRHGAAKDVSDEHYAYPLVGAPVELLLKHHLAGLTGGGVHRKFKVGVPMQRTVPLVQAVLQDNGVIHSVDRKPHARALVEKIVWLAVHAHARRERDVPERHADVAVAARVNLRVAVVQIELAAPCDVVEKLNCEVPLCRNVRRV